MEKIRDDRFCKKWDSLGQLKFEALVGYSCDNINLASESLDENLHLIVISSWHFAKQWQW